MLLAALLLFLGRRFPSRMSAIELPPEYPEPWGKAQWFVVAVLLFPVLGWLAPGIVGFTPGTVALLPVVAFLGTNLLRTSDLRALPWDVLMLIGGGLALGAAIEQSGLARWASTHIAVSELPGAR